VVEFGRSDTVRSRNVLNKLGDGVVDVWSNSFPLHGRGLSETRFEFKSLLDIQLIMYYVN